MKDLRKSWPTPPTGRTYLGFWTFNHVPVAGRSDDEEIRWQLDEMHAKGISEVIVHLRFGHAIPYLSERWRAIVATMLTHCERKGMGIWMWDEDAWPPGFAGGQLTHEHLEYRGRYPSTLVQPLPQGDGPQNLLISGLFPVAVHAVEKKSGRIIDVTEHVGSCAMEWNEPAVTCANYIGQIFHDDTIRYSRADKQYPSYWLHWQPPAGSWNIVSFLLNDGLYYSNGWAIDTLNPKAVAAWIQSTHEWYWKHFEPHFGKAIKGFYSAEPPHMRWTPALFDEFKAIKGYDLRPLLPHLTLDISEQTARVRMDYQEVHSTLYARHFIRQVREWCEAHRVAYAGRLGLEESPVEMVQHVGNLMAAIREFSVPVNDLINGLQIGDHDHPVINLGASMSFSISRQKGVSGRFECMGPIDWQTSLADTRPLYDWGVVMGGDEVCNENMFYSTDGYRKFDCPPSQFYQCPEWREFGEFTRRYERLGTLLRGGHDQRKVALLYPVSSLYVSQSAFASQASPAAKRIESSLIAIHQALLEAQVPFDLLDESLLDNCTAKRGILRAGAAAYDTVIIPLCSHLPADRAALLEKFARQGGGLLLQGGQIIEKVGDRKSGGRLTLWKPASAVLAKDVPAVVRHPRVARHRIAELPPEILSRRVVGRDFEAILLLNTALAETKLAWPAVGEGWERWCPDTGVQSPAQPGSLDPRELAVFVRPKGVAGRPSGVVTWESAAVPIRFDAEWEFEGLENCLYLDRWTLFVENALDTPPEKRFETPWSYLTTYEAEVGSLKRRIRWEHLPESQRKFFAQSYQDGVVPAAKARTFPLVVYYRAFFELETDAPTDLRLLLETEGIGGDWRLWINRREVDKQELRSHRVFDAGNRLLPLKRHLRAGAINDLIFQVRANQATDGLLQAVRVLGDFRIAGRTHPVLVPASGKILAGSWTTQGYPHASGWGRYHRQLKLDPTLFSRGLRWILDCGDMADACTVSVDGTVVGTRLWQPFHFDLTAALKRPDAELVIEVANNAGNIIAGQSKASGLIGPVVLRAVEPGTSVGRGNPRVR